MDYALEVYDTEGRRIARFTDVPLVEVVRTRPGEPDHVRGMLPEGVTDLSHGYRIHAIVDGVPVCDAYITAVAPQWGETRKLILDKYVTFREVIAFEAERDALDGNTNVSRAYTNRTVESMVRDVIQNAPGAIHYTVAHEAHPDGAQREYSKLLARKNSGNELGVGPITTGQWVGAPRIDASSAYAKDGDTISGLKVDGVAWPDVRLMLIDSEETSKNSHAVARHPEVAEWSAAQYDASGYKLRADAAKIALQALISGKGIDFLELNPHRDASGAFDDRVDAYGRYLALVFGGGECFNAALVEQGHADVYLYEDGKYLVPEMELKDFFSYAQPNEASVETAASTLVSFDASGGVLEALTALAYAASGGIWSVDATLRVRFRVAGRVDQVVYFDPVRMGVALGTDSSEIANAIYFEGNPVTGTLEKTYWRGDSIDAYGFHGRSLDHYGISLEEDADKLVEGLLEDVAYPEPTGGLEFLEGNTAINVGDLVEVRGAEPRRLDREAADEWGGRFNGRLVARVKSVTHRLSGRQVSTRIAFTSPLRSVADPLRFMVRSQPRETELFQFRLDVADVGLDAGYHLD